MVCRVVAATYLSAVYRLMSSQYVTWLLPYMVLDFGAMYAAILAAGAVYGFIKTSSLRAFIRDVLITLLVLASAQYGLRSGHSVIGLIGVGAGSLMSLSLHSREFAKTNDMAPFGHLTAISILVSLLVLSGILTSEL